MTLNMFWCMTRVDNLKVYREKSGCVPKKFIERKMHGKIQFWGSFWRMEKLDNTIVFTWADHPQKFLRKRILLRKSCKPQNFVFVHKPSSCLLVFSMFMTCPISTHLGFFFLHYFSLCTCVCVCAVTRYMYTAVFGWCNMFRINFLSPVKNGRDLRISGTFQRTKSQKSGNQFFVRKAWEEPNNSLPDGGEVIKSTW